MENSVNNMNRFISSLDTGQIRAMDTKGDNAEIVMGNKAESVDLLFYSFHKISLNRGGSYIDSSSWLKSKRATINPKNRDNECFKYAITVALNHEKIQKDPQRISKIKPFIDHYIWEGIGFLSHLKQ